MRDVRDFDRLGFLDINWQSYDFHRHLGAARATRPMITVARDIEDISCLERILDQARELNQYAEKVVVVPKDARLKELGISNLIPGEFILGFSVPTKYGQTTLPPSCFGVRPVHLLGGRPDTQRRLGKEMNVVSFDCNRFTLDAGFGDYFDGETFRPHPLGGYERCVHDSLKNINRLWA